MSMIIKKWRDKRERGSNRAVLDKPPDFHAR